MIIIKNKRELDEIMIKVRIAAKAFNDQDSIKNINSSNGPA